MKRFGLLVRQKKKKKKQFKDVTWNKRNIHKVWKFSRLND